MIPISKPQIGDAERDAVLRVLESGMLVQGPRVAELESLWSAACGTAHAVAVANGTAALHLALLANGIGPGDEVITTPFTFIASANSILFTGATPVFVDVMPCCFNIDPNAIEAAITPRTKAILPVHLFGLPCNMERIMQIAQKHGVKVIEDCAQSIGAEYAGRQTGSFGTGCFSLYATKNVMSVEGGMITTNDAEIARQIRLLRAHGMERRYYHDVLGFNLRLSDLHAAIGVEQVRRVGEFTQRRRANAAYLNAHIAHPSIVTPGQGFAGCARCVGRLSGHVWHQYTVRVLDGRRDEFVQRLTAAGIGTGVFYPVPVHRQKHMIERGFGNVSLPHAETAAQEVLSLPVHPALSGDDLQKIVEAVNAL
jgi:perosamine synthetase